MKKHDHHHCSGPGAQCDICGPDPRDAEIARLKIEILIIKGKLDAVEATVALRHEIADAFSAIPDATRKAAASLPSALAEVERWKMHHAQQVDENRRLRELLKAKP